MAGRSLSLETALMDIVLISLIGAMVTVFVVYWTGRRGE